MTTRRKTKRRKYKLSKSEFDTLSQSPPQVYLGDILDGISKGVPEKIPRIICEGIHRGIPEGISKMG